MRLWNIIKAKRKTNKNNCSPRLAQESSFAILRDIEAIFLSQVRNYTRNKLNWLKEDYLLCFKHFLIHKITSSYPNLISIPVIPLTFGYN